MNARELHRVYVRACVSSPEGRAFGRLLGVSIQPEDMPGFDETCDRIFETETATRAGFEALERAFAEGVAAEREACALLAERGADVAERIRARR